MGLLETAALVQLFRSRAALAPRGTRRGGATRGELRARERHGPCETPGMSYHAAVWLDHNQAKIFHVTPSTFEEETIHSSSEHRTLHRKSGPGAESGRRAPEDQHYYHDVAKALEDAQAILVLGPSTAKLEFIKHVQKHDHALEPRIIGVETVDHPTDRQIVTYVRKYFIDAGRMR